MIYRKHLSEPWYTLVKTGKKTVEGRLNSGDFALLCVGDSIVWYDDNDESFRTVIVSISCHKSFASMLKAQTLKRTLPGISTIAKGVDIYMEFYPDESPGVLAFLLQVMQN